MLYKLFVAKKLDAKFKKMSRKQKKNLEIISNKVKEIRKDPYRFKPLRGDLAGSRRVHIESSFVLLYDIDEKTKTVRLLDYDHHDKVYE